MIDHANLSVDAIDLADPTAPVSEALLLSSSVEEIDLLDPTSGESIGEVAESSAADAEATMKRARAQADDGRWSQMGPHERQSLLERLIAVMDDKADALTELGTLESGTPIAYSRSIHVDAPLRLLREASARPTENGLDVVVLPVNQPTYFAMRTVAASLAAGRATVIVPSPLASLTTIALMNCLLEADLPKGVVSAVLGTPDVLSTIRSSEAFSSLLDVGSGGADAGATPILQVPGADVDVTLKDALLAHQNAPGWRTGLAHLLVPEDELDDYLARASDLVDALSVGDPWSPDTQIGSIPGGSQALNTYLADLTSGSARLTQGAEPEDPRHFLAPTVVSGLTDPKSAASGAFAGPVACVIAYPDVDSAKRWVAGSYQRVAN